MALLELASMNALLQALTAGLLTALAASSQPSRLEMEVNAFVQDVRQHAPGSLDDPARRIAALPWATLAPVLEQIRAGGDEALLLRGATVLTDVARHVPLSQRPVIEREGRSIIAEDGDRRGRGFLDPHLSWGRRLIDRLMLDPRAPRHQEMRSHALAWFRAVSSWLASQQNLADLQPHVERSLALFPDVAVVVFDAGCYFETYASPAVQASVMAEDLSTPSHKRPADLMRAYATSGRHLLATADRHFERAVALDPALVEAQVRLGRVRTQRGQVDDSVVRLRRASALPADPTVRYFAYLFLGDALDRSGDPVGAEAAYRTASSLAPLAQSPQLSISRLSAAAGDDAAARAALERVFASRASTDGGFDPWWLYHRCSGRDVEALMAAYAARIEGVADTPVIRRAP
jgi:tetratricopeptide (TPR) repeat protein